jgi:signal transduction histidine kinase
MRSMSGQIFGILLIGVLTSTSLTLWLSLGERQQAYVQAREASAVERTEQLIAAVEALPESNREAFLAAAPRLGLRMVDNSFVMLNSDENGTRPTSYANKLMDRLGKIYQLEYLPDSASNCPRLSAEERALRGPCEGILIVMEDSSRVALSVLQPRSLLPPLNPDFFFSLIPFLLSIALLTYVVARMTTRPLKLLAIAAVELGQDINRPPLKERGSSEILQATRAFNAMQERIRQHITQRTHMLAAITHDLQTPLTRLRLRLEKVSDNELRDKLIGDLSAMQIMVKEGLDLARSMDSTESLKPLDLDSLLDSICLDAGDAGQNVSLEGHSYATVMARPQDLQRCLTNLIDNAVKYGGYAKVTLQTSEEKGRSWVHVLIRDGGSGIPEDQQLKVFEPFYRVESSRSRNTGGTGLGLTIAQNIAQQHGGSVSLHNLPQTGLEVRLSLPVRS